MLPKTKADESTLKIPVGEKLQHTKEKKDSLQKDYHDQVLLYNILLLNVYYKEMPLFLAQKRRKYNEMMSKVSVNSLKNFNELHAYWKFLQNFYF